MTNEAMNKAVAVALGWVKEGGYILAPYWQDLDGNKHPMLADWRPSINLQQAVDYIVPVLHDMGRDVCFDTSNDDVLCWSDVLRYNRQKNQISADGQGHDMSAKMAWALCEVFLMVKGNK